MGAKIDKPDEDENREHVQQQPDDEVEISGHHDGALARRCILSSRIKTGLKRFCLSSPGSVTQTPMQYLLKLVRSKPNELARLTKLAASIFALLSSLE